MTFAVLCCSAKVIGSLFMIVPMLLYLCLLPAQLDSIILSDRVFFSRFFLLFHPLFPDVFCSD